MSGPIIGISLGDPGGIGPEVVVKSLRPGVYPSSFDAAYRLFGTEKLIEAEIKKLGIKINISSLDIQEPTGVSQNFKSGIPCKENGEFSFHCFQDAVNEAEKGKLDAIVTAPISKQSWHLAGISWAGHTDYFNRAYPDAIMSFFSSKLNVALFTHHIPIKHALQKIKKQSLQIFFLRLWNILKNQSGRHWQFLVSGLNPHAGEGGLLGDEELKEIIPAVAAAQAQGMPISGPFPPDIICREALNQHQKIIISLFHDQGLIAFKLVAFNEGVNVTLGLPYIRTSPDHGTAFDIAGKGKADPQSMIAALHFAYNLSQKTNPTT